ncbi:MAG: PaaI family thioesterase [bacterium]
MAGTHHPPDPAFETRVRTSFARQAFMVTLGAQLITVEPGRVVIELPFQADHTQQHGFLHAGVVTALADSACGYAALSLMPRGTAVLSVEFKVNLMKPATGNRFRAVGAVLRAGRTLSVCSADVQARREGEWMDVAVMQATMMTVRDGGDLSD